jgi:hypothetical protein
MPDPDDDLYGLPLEEFTPARDAAAKALRKAGDREAAARVAKLPKPTPAAWAANQVAREQPELIEALLEAGAGLREAQDAAVAGHGSGGLREATLAQRSAVDAVMAAATAFKPGGRALSRPMADRLRTTLQAAAGDEALRDALSNGRMVNEAQAGGAWPFALEPGDAPPPPKPAAKKPAAKKRPGESREDAAARKAAEREERDAAERAEREQREREREERKQLESQLRDARMSLRVRERVAKGAAEDAEAAAQAVSDADERLEEAKQAAEESRAEAEAAQRVFTEAESELERARDEVARLEERLD